MAAAIAEISKPMRRFRRGAITLRAPRSDLCEALYSWSARGDDAPGRACGLYNVHSGSHIQIGDLQRVGLDELAARLDLVAHQPGEDLGGLVGVRHAPFLP